MKTWYKKLPVRPARSGHWMTPLTLVACAMFFFPALVSWLLDINWHGIQGLTFIILSFAGLFLWAYDMKWADYRARKAGLTWGLDKKTNKWTYI